MAAFNAVVCVDGPVAKHVQIHAVPTGPESKVRAGSLGDIGNQGQAREGEEKEKDTYARCDGKGIVDCGTERTLGSGMTIPAGRVDREGSSSPADNP